MNSAPSLGHILKSAIFAGLLAAAITAGFHSLATEPIIDEAIALEEARGAMDVHVEEEAAVSRPAQKLGLILGYGLYAVTLGMLFAAAYHGGRRLVPSTSEAVRSLWLSATAFACIGLLPMLKYPANPPGVGDPATIDARQAAYLALLGFAVVTGAASLLAARVGGRSLATAIPAAAGVLLLGGLLLFFGLPANTDEITVRGELLTRFRVMSLVGVTLFWLVFAAGFTWLVTQRPQRRRAAAPSPA